MNGIEGVPLYHDRYEAMEWRWTEAGPRVAATHIAYEKPVAAALVAVAEAARVAVARIASFTASEEECAQATAALSHALDALTEAQAGAA